jgi:hypothetical protein
MSFDGDGRAAIIIGKPLDPFFSYKFTGWHFVDCEVDGGFDHGTQTGAETKWGVFTWAVDDFVWSGGSIHNIKREHAIYMHNCLGDVLIEAAALYEVVTVR